VTTAAGTARIPGPLDLGALLRLAERARLTEADVEDVLHLENVYQEAQAKRHGSRSRP
jgi:hypothetical protein